MVKKPRKRQQREHPTQIGEKIYQLLADMGGSRDRCALTALWNNWPAIVGAELASLTTVIGHKNSVLFLAVEDALVMQEISFQTEEILARTNSFFKKKYFDQIRLTVNGLAR